MACWWLFWDQKWLAMSSHSYFLQTLTRSTCGHTNTLSEDSLYRSCAYLLLDEHHTAQSPHNLPRASLLEKLALITAPSSCCMWPCVPEHYPSAETAQYPQCSMGAPLACPVSWRTCSVKMTKPYVHTLRFPAPERFSITSSVVWLRISITPPVVCLCDSWHFDTSST